ncbi:hypothetical protein [Actinoplanes sp. GCM10030250]|uniref:hypothetical protein n=1 Tax=Actinoplanes sp. GCM10030250 TaxID=3273376 RepID=UPI00360D56E6
MATTTAARWLTVGGLAVAGLIAAAPAQAAPAAPGSTGAGAAAVAETYLLTRPSGGTAALNQIGSSGVTSGLWTSFRLRGGFAGYDLLVTHQQRTTLRPAPILVYTAPPGNECTDVGNRGVAGKVWLSFTCRIGVAGNDLMVR